jgi:hypothetical protein
MDMKTVSRRRSRRLVGVLFLIAFGAGAATLLLRPGEPPEISAAPPAPAAPAEVGYVRDIRPILSNRCFKCHGPDFKKAGLDLQTQVGATKLLKSGHAAIVPGKPGESELLARVTATEAGLRMPPPGKGEALSPEQVAVLRKWIEQGANYEEHWSFVKPARPAPPAVKNAAWARNPIDRFVLARLEREGLSPSPEADKAVLLRRASLDLTGLPPTIEDVDAFLADKSPDAFEKAVDRLLASPHYGERQAMPWLDQARYADTNGYENDARRTIWPYRDWVIAAFNRDLPFDRFTIEQIAGDLLPGATLEQRIATGFHRNTMVNTEGGTDDEEFRVAAVVDRVNTTMEAWMAITMACVQCHNHKFDPFSQKDYYGLYAFFNNTEDRGRSNAPEIPVPTAEQQKRLERVRAEIAAVQKTLDSTTPEIAAAQAKWEQSLGSTGPLWTPLTPVEVKSANGATLQIRPDGSVHAGGALPNTDTYTVSLKTDLKGITGLRLDVMTDASLPGNGPGRSGNFVLSEIRVSAAPAAGGQAVAIGLQNATADFSQDSWSVTAAIDSHPKTGWGIAPQTGKAHTAVFETRQSAGFDGGTVLTVVMEQNYSPHHSIGRFRLSATTAARPVRYSTLPPAVASALAEPAAKRSAAQKDEIAGHYRSISPELKSAREKLTALKKQEADTKPTTTLVMKELAKPRETFIHVRGNHQRKGEVVTFGVPAKLHPLAAGAPKNRLGLAMWLVDRDNPLTARVTVNRVWARYFGRGFVETSEDFGVQGDLPTHPELLDWLAVEFMEPTTPLFAGKPGPAWSFKTLHKLIVTSAAYRQSSKVGRELLERDPFNRLFARGPRLRLEAEMVRDNALAISGLLNRKIGGASVFPYQPDGIWFNPYSSDRWVNSAGEDRYRRGLYTFWRRTAPYAAFMAFDAPSREVCCERRPRTNTPLQALAVLNDKPYVEAASALAGRMVQAGPGARERAVRGFRLCVARSPSEAEVGLLLALHRDALAKYRADAGSAKALPGAAAVPAGIDAAEFAAWIVVGNVLLNLDETITKG